MAGLASNFFKALRCTDLNKHQHRRPLPITGRTALVYLIRFLTSLLTMEIILHFMYVVAIKDTKAWVGDSPAEISMIGFWNLIIVWLKVRQNARLLSCSLPRNTRIDQLPPLPTAANTLEILSVMGAHGQYRPT